MSLQGVKVEYAKNSGNVTVADEPRVVIHRLVVDSPELHKYLFDSEDRIGACVRCLQVGATALQRVSTASDLDYIKRMTAESFGALEKSIITLIQKTVDPADSGSASGRIVQLFRAENNVLRELLAQGKTSVGALDIKIEGFKKALEGALQESLSKALNGTEGMGLLLRSINDSISSLRESLVTKDVRSKASAAEKGANFEEHVLSTLQSWVKGAHSAGIEAVIDDCRTTAGIDGKTGDFVLRLCVPDEARIAIECKAQAKISVPRLLEVLNQSIKNRNADMAIYVSPHEMIPGEIGGWGEYSDKIICCDSVLDIALRYCALRLRSQRQNEDRKDLDQEKAAALLQESKIRLKKFSILIGATRATTKASGHVEELAIAIRDSVSEILDELSSVLTIRSEAKNTNSKPDILLQTEPESLSTTTGSAPQCSVETGAIETAPEDYDIRFADLPDRIIESSVEEDANGDVDIIEML
jgi:hypothetical protein